MADQFVWTSADGKTVIDLTDESGGYSVLANGTRGLRSVPYTMATVEYAGIDGTTVQSVKAAANTVTLGLLMSARDGTEFSARSRGLVRAMRPKAGPGTLVVSRSDGSSRSLACYCTEGLEGDESTDTTLTGAWWKLALKLYAPMPWWLGDPVTLNVGLGAGSAFFPFFPLSLAPSAVQGQFTVDLSGSDDGAYPVWTITGPGSALTLSNTTREWNPDTQSVEDVTRSIQVNTTLAAGDSMVIDTRPGQRSVRSGTGANLMGALASDPALWPLIEDVNNVTAMLTGATTASRITGVYQPRYAGI